MSLSRRVAGSFLAGRREFKKRRKYSRRRPPPIRALAMGPTMPRMIASRFVKPGYTRAGGNWMRFGGPGGEKKWFNTTLSFTFDTTAEAVTSLNLIPQGTTEVTVDRDWETNLIQLPPARV